MQTNNETEINSRKCEARKRKMRKRKHLNKLNQLEMDSLAASCCDICHCNCYSSHNVLYNVQTPRKKSSTKCQRSCSLNLNPHDIKSTLSSKHKPTLKNSNKNVGLNRSKSHGDLVYLPEGTFRRDCDILENLLSSKQIKPQPTIALSELDLRNCRDVVKMHGLGELNTVNICNSLAQLCLEPKIHRAYQNVPIKDQRIINGMATKRAECVVAKQNALLAHKYWENERVEQDILKSKELKEYKQSICEKQLNDYMIMHARLRRIAEKDNNQLQQLRDTLQVKDQRTNERLMALNIKRKILLCQRRCEELRKMETVNMHQEEIQLENMYRRQRDYARLGERIKHADQMRTYWLSANLRRIQYDNKLEQLIHEEQYRQKKMFENHQREQLCDHIRQKSMRIQKFVESKQRRNMALIQTAKLSASLRELVRKSLAVDEKYNT